MENEKRKMLTMPDTSSGDIFFTTRLGPLFTSIRGLPLPSATTPNGKSFLSFCTELSEYCLPISRFTSNTVPSGLEEAWFFAASPMKRVDSSVEEYPT